MTRIRAWLRQVDPGAFFFGVVLLACAGLLAAVWLRPVDPGPGPLPPSTAAYGQPDTMQDVLEARVTELEARVTELERERR